ncbi:type II toxin-antitoxin system PemK/MazF family toxin [Streptomyces sp. NPDC052309]|uniref:type II toxin-antitoxin system PemK/MazF family toxin n=1 Tax=Streptomyces sp. NPDC052309 TaxID=3155421 RepID=UPI00341407F4
MDTSWWLALAAVVLLALVAVVVDGWGRGPRPGRRLRPWARPAGPGGRTARPRPAEIWWASVPDEEPRGAGAGPGLAAGEPRGGPRDRPCLVIAVRRRRVVVARITSRYRDERAGVIPLPPGSVGNARGRTSFLETDELREVPVRDFRRRVGVVDPVLWDQVRHLAT